MDSFVIWNSKTIVKLVGLASVGLGIASAPVSAQATKSSTSVPQTAQQAAKEKSMIDRAGGPLGSGFIQNKGQWDSRALYFSGGQSVDTWVTNSSVLYDFHHESMSKVGTLVRSGHVVEMQFVGASSNATATGSKDTGRVVHFVGVGSSISPKSYSTATVHNLYNGVDLQLSREDGQPRFDIVLGAGKDPSQVKLRYNGANGVTQNRDGTLNIQTSVGDQAIANLHAYQQSNGKESPVQCDFVLQRDGSVGFKVGHHDATKPVTIDPVVYSTLLGDGGGHNTQGFGVYVGTDGAPVITGYTQAPTFPTTVGAYNGDVEGGNSTPGGGITGSASVFVTKFTNDATNVIYSTVINSTSVGIGMDVAVDASGKIFVSGIAQNGYSVFEDAYQNQVLTGNYAQFLSILSSDASQLLVSTFYGGGFELNPKTSPIGQVQFLGEASPRFYKNYLGLHLDGKGFAYLTGKGTVKTTSNAYQTANQGDGTYIACFNNAGTFTWASYFTAAGTSTNDIYVATDGSIYACGMTNGGLVATSGAYDTGARGNDGFVARFNAVTTPTTPLTVSYITFIGGSGGDHCDRITADGLGEAFAYGTTSSVDFPYSANAFSKGGGNGGYFIAKFPVDGSRLLYSTLVGDYYPEITSIAVDSLGQAYITGSENIVPPTSGVDLVNDDFAFNVFNFTEGSPMPPDNYYSPGDVILTVMNASGTGLVYNGFFGGTYDEEGEKVVLDAGDNAYIVGWTDSFGCSAPASTEYPVTGGVFDSAYARSPLTPPVTAPWYIPPVAFLTKVRVTNVPFLAGLQIPSVIAGGLGGSGVVSLNSETPTDLNITLVSSNPAVASVPGSAVITRTFASDAGGQPVHGTAPNTITAAGPFPITATDLTVLQNVTITASNDDVFLSRTVVIAPYLQSFSVAVEQIVGGNTTSARLILSVPTPLPPAPDDPHVSIPMLTVTVTSSDPTKAQPVNQSGTPTSTFSVYSSFISTTTNQEVFSNNIIIPIQTYGVDAASQVTLFAQITNPRYAYVASSTVQVLPAHVAAIQFSPDVLIGGNSSQGVVQLDGAIGPTARTVTLGKTSGTAVLGISPTTLTIPAGANSGAFSTTTQPVNANSFGTVTATEPLSGANANGTLYVQPVQLSGVTVKPTILVGGSTTSGYVTLGTVAPSTGVSITLASSNPALVGATVKSVAVAAGAYQSATFTIKTNVSEVQQLVTLTASNGQYSAATTITVLPQTLTLTVTPTTVQGGLQSISGTVKLSAVENVPITVGLSSSNTALLSLSASSVTFPAGTTTESFVGHTSNVTSNQSVTVKASLMALPYTIVQSQVVTVIPIPLVVNVSPSTLVGGVQNGAGDVVLPQNATVATAVTLSTSNPAVAGVPSSVTIAKGSNVANFTVTTAAVLANTNVLITGKDAAGTNSFTITVTPAQLNLISLTMSPSTVNGGFNSTGTLTTSGAVPANGVNVALTSSSPGAAQVPSSVLVKHGSTVNTFVATTAVTKTDTTVTITATYNGKTTHGTLLVLAGRTGTLTIKPTEVIGGTNATLTASISTAAPAGGLLVTITDSPYIAGITVNGQALTNGGSVTVTIPAGKTTASFTVTTPAVSRQLGTTFTATFGTNGNQSSATLLMDPQS